MAQTLRWPRRRRVCVPVAMSQRHGCVSSPLLASVLLSRVLWVVARGVSQQQL